MQVQDAHDPRGPAEQYSTVGMQQYDAVEAKLLAVRQELQQLLEQEGLPLDTATCAALL